MKKLFSLVLLASILLSMCGCEDKVDQQVDVDYVVLISENLLDFLTPVIKYHNGEKNVEFVIDQSNKDYEKVNMVDKKDGISVPARAYRIKVRFNHYNVDEEIRTDFLLKKSEFEANKDKELELAGYNSHYLLKSSEETSSGSSSGSLSDYIGECIFKHKTIEFIYENLEPMWFRYSVDNSGKTIASGKRDDQYFD